MFFPSGVLLRSDEPPHCPDFSGPMPIGLFRGSLDRAAPLAVSFLASRQWTCASGSAALARAMPSTRIGKPAETIEASRFMSDRGFI